MKPNPHTWNLFFLSISPPLYHLLRTISFFASHYIDTITPSQKTYSIAIVIRGSRESRQTIEEIASEQS